MRRRAAECSTASWISRSPIRAITTGFSADWMSGMMALATAPAEDMGGAGKMTITLSTPGSASRMRRQRGVLLRAMAEASMSTGLCRLAAGGSNACRAAAGGPGAGRQAQPVQLERVRGGHPGPAGVGQHGHAAPAGQRAPGQGPGPLEHLLGGVGADHAGLLRRRRRRRLLRPASAPVCEAAARCPLAKRPTLSASSGFGRVTWRASSMKRRPSLIPSR